MKYHQVAKQMSVGQIPMLDGLVSTHCNEALVLLELLTIKHYTADRNKLDCYVTSIHFHPSLMFVGKAVT